MAERKPISKKLRFMVSNSLDDFFRKVERILS